MTPSGPTDLIEGAERLAPVTITARLRLPAGAGPFAAMVIAHGSGGVSAGREFAWADRLGQLGLATLVVDSFGPRGIRSTGENQQQLSTMANVADAFAALQFLAGHPAIDARRIGIIGFSRGGQAALYTALEPFGRAAANQGLRFAAHLAFYPSCNLPYLSREVTGAPVLFALGEADDYTPPQPCLRYAEWFRERGAPVSVVVYPGAGHGFDTPGAPRLMRSVQTARSCAAEIELEPVRLRRRDTGEVHGPEAIRSFLAGCMERGAHFGGNPAALARAVDDVAAFVRATLRP